jgi:hypothetical protein
VDSVVNGARVTRLAFAGAFALASVVVDPCA